MNYFGQLKVLDHGLISRNLSFRTTDPASLIATGFPPQFKLVEYLDVLKTLMQKTHGIRRAGAASYDLCCVAAGREKVFEYGLSPWDVAAGSPLKKLGMSVTGKGKIIDIWKRIIAGNKQVVEFLKKEISNSFGKKTLNYEGKKKCKYCIDPNVLLFKSRGEYF